MESISVVIPAYNAGVHLSAALDSVLSQTRAPKEIIVVDDCSTDNTGQVVYRYRGAGVKLLRTPINGRAATARNLGIAAASGKLIAFLDSDDLWHPHHLATVGGLLDEFPEADLAFSCVENFGSTKGLWPMVLPDGRPVSAFWQAVTCCVAPQMSVVCRRSALLEVGSYRPQFWVAEDYELFLRMAFRSPFVCTHEVTAFYRQHPLSAMSQGTLESRVESCQARHLFLTQYGHSLDPEERTRFEQLSLERWSSFLAAARN